MITIKVVSEVKVRHVETADKAFDIRYQEADLLLPNGRPRPTEVRPPGKAEYPLGFYTLAPQSLTTDLYDRLQLRYVALVPLSDAIDSANQTLRKRKQVPGK